jgi:5-methylcytosine-specific restriction protein A
MAQRAMRQCNHPGCAALVKEGYCEEHKNDADSYRASSGERGYDSRWRRYRSAYLARHPLCVECEREGRVTRATDVDHIVPIKGQADPLFWREANHQGLCHACHSRKTVLDRARGGAYPLKRCQKAPRAP